MDKMDKPRKYYTLVVKRNGVWYPQFGDYDKEVVSDEQYDCYDTEVSKVICTHDDQFSIDGRVKELNK